jgi:hypothetical protein
MSKRFQDTFLDFLASLNIPLIRYDYDWIFHADWPSEIFKGTLKNQLTE